MPKMVYEATENDLLYIINHIGYQPMLVISGKDTKTKQKNIMALGEAIDRPVVVFTTLDIYMAVERYGVIPDFIITGNYTKEGYVNRKLYCLVFSEDMDEAAYRQVA